MLETLTTPKPSKPKRRHFTAEHKRLIAQQALAPGASVSRVARAHDVNANQVFKWKREYLQSQSATSPIPSGATQLLPVILTETSVPASTTKAAIAPDGAIELHLSLGRVVLTGNVNTDVLRIVLQSLAR
jgi:transposase